MYHLVISKLNIHPKLAPPIYKFTADSALCFTVLQTLHVSLHITAESLEARIDQLYIFFLKQIGVRNKID